MKGPGEWVDEAQRVESGRFVVSVDEQPGFLLVTGKQSWP